MAKSDADVLRSYADKIQFVHQEAVTEAFGEPMGLLKQLSLGIASAFDSSKQWKYVTGNYANQLYWLWRKSSPPNATGEDLISWFETNKSTGFGPGASDLNYKTLNYIVSKVTRNVLDEPLTPVQLQQIFLQLSDAVARQLRGFTTKVIRSASDEQQSQVLQLLPKFQQFVYAQKQNITLHKIALWLWDNVPQANEPHIRGAFKKWQAQLVPLGAATVILPQPFDVLNQNKLSPVEISAVISLLDELLLQVILIRDHDLQNDNTSAKPSSPVSPTQKTSASPSATSATKPGTAPPPAAPSATTAPTIAPSPGLPGLLASVKSQIKPDDYLELIAHLKSMGINVTS
jgi:hypothetical protein